LRFYEGAGVGVLKIEESELEVLCTDSTALLPIKGNSCRKEHTMVYPKVPTPNQNEIHTYIYYWSLVPLQSNAIPSLCNGSTTAANANSNAVTDFLKLHLGQSKLFLNFNNILETTSS
jgi:hypothetical protein